jgi:ABC-type nitrate/sulfonate/bicarbonate transport system substrate-binding protein
MIKVSRQSILKSFACLGAAVCLMGCEREPNQLTFALPVADWWTAAPFIISQSDSVFQHDRLELSTIEVPSGLASKNAVLAGTADVGVTAATPLALAAARSENLVVLGTYLQSSSIVGLVRLEQSIGDTVPPEPIAIVPSTISEWFLYEYLGQRGKGSLMQQEQLKELHVRPADVPGALRSGSARSAVIWEPFLTFSDELPGFVIDTLTSGFDVSLYIITRPEVLVKKRAAVQRFLAGVEGMTRYLAANPVPARTELERHFGFRAGFLSPRWSNVRYGLQTDTTVMAAEILRDAQTAQALGYISAVPQIDYLFRTR